jgi:hypothetical protein
MMAFIQALVNLWAALSAIFSLFGVELPPLE